MGVLQENIYASAMQDAYVNMQANKVIWGTQEGFEEENILFGKSVLGIFIVVGESQTEIVSFELRSVDHCK